MRHTSLEVPIANCRMPGDLLCAVAAPDLVRFELGVTISHIRSPIGDSSVVVAIVAGGSTALSALFSGVLKIRGKHRDTNAKIVVRGSNDATIEFHAGSPPGALPKLVGLPKALDEPPIGLHV